MFRISEIINNFSTNITNNPILANPFYSAGIIVGIFLFIIYVVAYGEVEPVYDDTSLLSLTIKSTFFGFVGVLCILFLSYNNIENINKRKYKNENDVKSVNIIEGALEETVKPAKY